MNLDIRPASDYPLTELTQLLNLSFEDYLVPVNFNLVQFLTMLRKDSIDLFSSRVLIMEDEPSGLALIARRGWSSRLAAMGILQSRRGLGAGQWLLEQLIQEARDRQEHEMSLEVIEQNEYAVRLYRRCGFQSIRRLIGLVCVHRGENNALPLEEIDLREAGKLISQFGVTDLPWQLAGETIAHLTPPARAYRKGQTYMVTSNPEAEHVVIWSLLVEPSARGNHLSLDMLRNVMANYPDKTWHVPAIFPEEFGNIFEMAGFEREDISQWQMRLVL
jgi:ribosomal protein S18 acetylase RimI-like enzyme